MAATANRSHFDKDIDYSPLEVSYEGLGLLEMSRATVYNHIKSGEIKACTNELGHLRISEQEVRRLQAQESDRAELAPEDYRRWIRQHAGGRIGGNRNVAKHGRETVARPMHEGRWAALEHKVDPNGELSPEERRDRAYHEMVAGLQRANQAKQEKKWRRRP